MKSALHCARLMILLVAAGWSGAAAAHALLVSVRGEKDALVGRVYYSDGAQATGEFLQLVEPDAPHVPPRTTTSDGQGAFRFDGVVAGRRYRVIAEGEEGHVTEIDIVHAEGGRGTLHDPESADGEKGIPAWLVLGGLLTASAVPALWLRFRKASPPA